MTNNELYHYGILGMKWGVRRYQPYPKGHTGGREIGEAARARSQARQEKKRQKELKKSQSKWDKKAKKNYINAYNNATDYANSVLIPKINKKYKQYDFSDLSDPKIEKIYGQYLEEYSEKFNQVLNKKLVDLIGERPE